LPPVPNFRIFPRLSKTIRKGTYNLAARSVRTNSGTMALRSTSVTKRVKEGRLRLKKTPGCFSNFRGWPIQKVLWTDGSNGIIQKSRAKTEMRSRRLKRQQAKTTRNWYGTHPGNPHCPKILS